MAEKPAYPFCLADASTEMTSIVFLLGAGFGVDAASEAGNPIAASHPARYPLVSDLGKMCFGLDTLPADKSIEELFQESIATGDLDPIETLYDLLMEADYYITPVLRPDSDHSDNTYLRFLRDFPSAPLLTFNYDSLPELLLLSVRSWRPDDGYGVAVQLGGTPIQDTSLVPERSVRPVLHLHGTLCVYPVISYIQPGPRLGPDMLRLKDAPDFVFDPDALAFVPFEGVPAGHGYKHIPDRVIAPVPDKAEGLKSKFIKAVYSQAKAMVTRATQIVVIGYSFNPHDHTSYAPLLAAATGRRVFLVTPEAHCLLERLAEDYPRIHWEGASLSFRDWVRNGYPGVTTRENVI